MVQQELLDILVCPENHQRVSLATDELVAKVNTAIGAGALKNRGGEAVTERVDGGLVREDGAVFYIIRDDIPIMIVEEGILLESPAL